MGGLDALSAADVRAALQAYRDALVEHRHAINQLNVYPVPDGDTGTNMSLTLTSVVDEVGDTDDMAALCEAMSHGSLMGARGNSGVILSQILRGLAAVLGSRPVVDASAWADGLQAASDAAYGAVQRPVEGTILTVVRETAAAAADSAGRGADLPVVLERCREAGSEALDRTPTQLPALAAAGVVDAGGAGFLLLVDALLHVVEGRPMPEPPVVPEGVGVGAATGAAAGHDPAHGSPPEGDQRYEVMFFLEAPDDRIDGFRRAWAALGDSIVVVGGDGLWNCHVHTNDIGGAIEAGIGVGRPRDIRVTDLHEQVEHLEHHDAPPHVGDPVRTAVVAVALGDGVRRILESLGARFVVSGGQTMNPSTRQLVDAVAGLGCEEAVILPNNKNVIAVAEQVDAEVELPVEVVATRSVPEGLAALLAYDPEASAVENGKAMLEAAGRVVTGEITCAVRASASEVGSIEEGDYLALGPSGIVAVAPTLGETAEKLLDALIGPDHELVTVIVGAGVDAGQTADLADWLAATHPDLEVEVHEGGQPLYPYYFGVE